MKWLVLALSSLLFSMSLPVMAEHEIEIPHKAAAPDIRHEMMMESPIGLPANRHGSGTSWMPDSTPMYALMQQAGVWGLMYHGRASLAYDDQNGPRGDQKLVILNWGMAMAQRSLGEGNQLRLSAMLSLEPETVGGTGYPLIFQTGETWRGEPLVDHQHPHNFISELSAKYTRALTPGSAGFVYAAPVGEPALGPVTYLHRTFGLDDPLAPLGHHWQDSTHIAYGVVTLGYQRPKWQLEGSTFNGREPGENRYEIVGPRFDSFSGRLSYNPSTNWALQSSYGFLKSPEALHPEDDVHRATASAIYNRPLGLGRNFQSTFVWGRNNIDGLNLDSFLLEGEVKKDGGWSLYTRYEWIEKNSEELVLPETFPPDEVFDLQQLTIGAVRDLSLSGRFQWGIGVQVNFNFVPERLVSVYGNDPTGWLIFLRVHPKRMEHSPVSESSQKDHGVH